MDHQELLHIIQRNRSITVAAAMITSGSRSTRVLVVVVKGRINPYVKSYVPHRSITFAIQKTTPQREQIEFQIKQSRLTKVQSNEIVKTTPPLLHTSSLLQYFLTPPSNTTDVVTLRRLLNRNHSITLAVRSHQRLRAKKSRSMSSSAASKRHKSTTSLRPTTRIKRTRSWLR